jgi:hypothetical protein
MDGLDDLEVDQCPVGTDAYAVRVKGVEFGDLFGSETDPAVSVGE